MNRKAPIIFSLIYLLGSVSVFAQTVSEPNPPDPKKTTIRGNAPLPPKRVPSVPLNEVNAEGFFGFSEENVYTNEFHGFELTFPAEYTVLSRAQLELVANAAKDVIKKDNNAELEEFEEALYRTAVLLTIAQKPLGTPGNGAIEIGVVRQAKGVTANMANLSSVNAYVRTGKYSIVQTIRAFKIDGREFVGFDLVTDAFGIPVNQRSFVTMLKDYALLISISYQSEESLNELERLVKGIKFFETKESRK